MLRAKNAHTRNLWGKEFSIVGNGLAEADVVAFVSELLQQQEHQNSLMELAQRTLTEAEQAALSLREKAKSEADAEAARIVSHAQAQADEIAQEARRSVMAQAEEEARAITQRIYSRFMEVAQEEMGKEAGRAVDVAPTVATTPFPQPEPGDPLTQNIEEALENWQAMPINSDTPPSPEENAVSLPELVPEVPQANGEDPTDGEVGLIVAPPIDLAQLTSFQRRLRQQSQVRLIQTVGSWNQGLAITILIKQSLPLIETLQGMPEVESVQGSDGDEKEAGRELRKRVNISLRRRPRQEAEGSSV